MTRLAITAYQSPSRSKIAVKVLVIGGVPNFAHQIVCSVKADVQPKRRSTKEVRLEVVLWNEAAGLSVDGMHCADARCTLNWNHQHLALPLFATIATLAHQFGVAAAHGLHLEAKTLQHAQNLP